MGLGVTVAAIGHGWVLVLMTEGAVECVMLGLTVCKLLKYLGVAGAAKFRGSISRVVDIKRHMGIVTAQTVIKDHERAVALVDLIFVMAGETTVDNLVLGWVAECAVMLGVLAGVSLECLSLVAMTGVTNLHAKWCVVHGDI